MDHDSQENEIIEVKIPGKILNITITKNDFGLADVLIKDLTKDEMVVLMDHICELFNVSDANFSIENKEED